VAGKSEPIATQLQAGHKNLTALGDTCLRLFSINGTGRLRLRPSAKAQRKSPAEAGRMSRACAAPDAITVIANNDSRRSSHGGRLAGTVGARIYGSSKPYVAQAREQLRLLDFRSLALPRHRRFRQVQCQPQRLLPACIFALRLISTCWGVAKTSRLCLRATALMQIKIQPLWRHAEIIVADGC